MMDGIKLQETEFDLLGRKKWPQIDLLYKFYIHSLFHFYLLSLIYLFTYLLIDKEMSNNVLLCMKL